MIFCRSAIDNPSLLWRLQGFSKQEFKELPQLRSLAENRGRDWLGPRSVPGTLRTIEKYGGLAQLGERLHGMQEVIGSSPLSSTMKPRHGEV